VYNNLADDKAKKTQLPQRLERIQSNLGEMFKVAESSYEKAKGGILGVDQSAMQLRDVIQQLWGGVVNFTRERVDKRYKGTRFSLRKEPHRNIIANALSVDDIGNKKLVTLLNTMDALTCPLNMYHYLC
jgi:hypothetical protein